MGSSTRNLLVRQVINTNNRLMHEEEKRNAQKKMAEEAERQKRGYDIAWGYDNNNFSYGYAVVIRISDKKENIINKSGKIQSDIWFDKVYRHDNHNKDTRFYPIVKKDGKFNLIQNNGKLVSDTWYDSVSSFHDELAEVKKDNKYNYINKNGKIQSDIWFDKVFEFKNGHAQVRSNNKWNFIDTNCNIISNIWYDEIGLFDNGYAIVKKENKMNFIDTKGSIISDTWYDSIHKYESGYSVVRKSGKCNLLDQNKHLISDIWYDDFKSYDDGWIVKKDNKYSIITSNGVIINNLYDEIEILSFHLAKIFLYGYAKVRMNDKYNLLDSSGKLFSNTWYDDIYPFPKGVKVCKDSKYNIIGENGTLISDTWYDDIEYHRNGVFCIKNGGMVDYINIQGQLLGSMYSQEFIDSDISAMADLANYNVRKTLLGYQLEKGNDIFKIKYKPVRVYNDRFVLCINGNNLILFDRKRNVYEKMGTIKMVSYQDLENITKTI